MAVSIEEIRYMAALARLRLREGEAERMARDMSSILEYMAVLGAVDFEAEPVPRSLRGAARPADEDSGAAREPSSGLEARPDPLALPLSRLAPEWKDGLFLVPRLPGVAGRPDEAGEAS